MKCFVCGNDTPGEVCNQCVRTEKSIFHKDWEIKEGFLKKKVDEYKLDITSCRFTGTGTITNSESGLNGRVDGFNHFVGNIVRIDKKPLNGKDTVMVHCKNPVTGVERFIFFPGLDDVGGVNNAVDSAKSGLGSGAPAGGGGAASGDYEMKVKKLQVLLESGILSQEEFEKEKAKIAR